MNNTVSYEEKHIEQVKALTTLVRQEAHARKAEFQNNADLKLQLQLLDRSVEIISAGPFRADVALLKMMLDVVRKELYSDQP